MKRLWLPLILFLITILEGVALELLPTSLVTGDVIIIPHWVLVVLVFISIFYDQENTYTSVFFGVIFGLLIDIVYTGILGVYMFSYAFVIYIVHGLKKMLHANIFVTLLLGIFGIAVTEIIIYLIFLVINFTDMPWKVYSIYRLIPTILANLSFLLILYPFIGKRLAKWRDENIAGTG